MVEISKFMTDNNSLRFLPCSELVHPWTPSCTDAFITMLYSCTKGTIKFYTPIQAMLLVSIKNNNNVVGTY